MKGICCDKVESRIRAEVCQNASGLHIQHFLQRQTLLSQVTVEAVELI